MTEKQTVVQINCNWGIAVLYNCAEYIFQVNGKWLNMHILVVQEYYLYLQTLFYKKNIYVTPDTFRKPHDPTLRIVSKQVSREPKTALGTSCTEFPRVVPAPWYQRYSENPKTTPAYRGSFRDPRTLNIFPAPDAAPAYYGRTAPLRRILEPPTPPAQFKADRLRAD
jgi:hypothetical protein